MPRPTYLSRIPPRMDGPLGWDPTELTDDLPDPTDRASEDAGADWYTPVREAGAHEAAWDTAASYGKDVALATTYLLPFGAAPHDEVTDGDHTTYEFRAAGVPPAGTYPQGYVIDLGASLLVSKVTVFADIGYGTHPHKVWLSTDDPGFVAGGTCTDAEATMTEAPATVVTDDPDGWDAYSFSASEKITIHLTTPTTARYVWWGMEFSGAFGNTYIYQVLIPGSETIWVYAPEVNDGDDDTYRAVTDDV